MKYDYDNPKYFDDEFKRSKKSSVRCECGNNEFFINWIVAPFTGGYGKITCSQCGKEDILIDDYA